MRQVLYDVEWQRLRISLLQARRNDGGWSTFEGMENNLQELENYLKDAHTVEEAEVRRYRVNNCLNAVVMGYNGQMNGDDWRIAAVREFRDLWASCIRDRIVRVRASSWNWDYQLRELITLYGNSREEFQFLQDNLTRRSQNGTRRTRPELYKFLDLMKTATRT